MKKRSNITVMAKLIGLVRPLTGYMILAIFLGLLGHLCASLLTVFGGYALLGIAGVYKVPTGFVFTLLLVCAFARGFLRYGEQSCNHFIAFKLLALLRDRVFFALRRLSPAKLEGRDRGDLIAVITSDIELLEVFYAHTISPAVVALANLGSTLQNTFAAGNRVLDILEEKPQVEEVTGKEKVTFRDAGAEQVTFSYGSETILSDVSCKIPANTVTGIIGKSGSGKSTLLKLFLRFFEVKQGEIKISGVPVADINTSDLRAMESYMTQETSLFHDSIANNLKVAKPDATEEELTAACKKASIHDFIISLPKGYDTEVGELGDTLSGGERQRIGLARVFLHDAPFILLDEPTSNLDSLNEAVILQSLAKERGKKTVVLVSHRPSTMRIADQVYSVENGRMS